jgi:hypothetical protein
MQLRIEISIDAYNEPGAQGNLRISETVMIDPLGFIELAQILGRFHELAAKITEEREARHG